jgi:hypothetical protein
LSGSLTSRFTPTPTRFLTVFVSKEQYNDKHIKKCRPEEGPDMPSFDKISKLTKEIIASTANTFFQLKEQVPHDVTVL